MIDKNFGILASIDWNSNKWKDLSTDEDLSKSNFGYSKEHNVAFTSLNFGHEVFPADRSGFYQGLLPQLWAKMPDKEKASHIKVAFVRSLNYHDGNVYLIGFYAFPEFNKGRKSSPVPSVTVDFEVNFKALPADIVLLETPVNLTGNPDLAKFLPKGKETGTQRYNYLSKASVFKILDIITSLNPSDKRLHSIKFRLIKTINSN